MDYKRFVPIVMVALVAGCLEKPPPWVPGDGVLSDAPSDTFRVADHKGEVLSPEQDVRETAELVLDDSHDAGERAELVLDGWQDVGETAELVLDSWQDVGEAGELVLDGSTSDCVPSCQGKECGDDGCGGSCGECEEGKICSETGQCISYCDWVCESLKRECGTTGPPYNCDCGDCTDDNICTDDICDEEGHCRYENKSTGCDDGNPCTLNDVCSNGICVGEPLDCNDNNPCTDDYCWDGKCVWSYNDDAPCDDGNPCTKEDKCFKGVCQLGSPVSCDDNVACTVDSCVEGIGCVYIPTDSLCDDGNVCTDEHCDQTEGCVTTFNALPCDDGNPCTVGDYCQNGNCVKGSAALTCNDGDPCTQDWCDPAKGCLHESVDGEPCDDNNVCTTNDICINGVCTGGAPLDCNDENPCTGDGCTAESGCWHAPVANNTPCGKGMSCQAGVCQPYCGDGLCADGEEDHCNCPMDCPAWTCSGCCAGSQCLPGTSNEECGKNGEACQSCLDGKMCQNQTCEYKCGDGFCASDGNETCLTCPADCGACCGNGKCDNDETCLTCPADCGLCCGDGECDGNAGETFSTCPADCGAYCGNEQCDDDETCATCPADCGLCCGDGVCDDTIGEMCSTCPADCSKCCPNGACAPDETCFTCPEDCGKCEVTQGFVKIKKGSFWMGSPEGCNKAPAGYPDSCSCNIEPGHHVDETLHYVQLTHDFEMQVHEVTQGEWKEAFGGWNPSLFNKCGSNCPVERVSWYDACAYANWKSDQKGLPLCYVFSEVKCRDGSDVGENYKECLNGEKQGIQSATVGLPEGVATPYKCQGFRLPTEAEWEYAARAGSCTAFYPVEGTTGEIQKTKLISCDPMDPDPSLHLIGWYCANAGNTTHPVEGKKANAWGLMDMIGNVWEWCWDWHGPYSVGTQNYPDEDPIGQSGGNHRVLRGGSWRDYNKHCRSARREFKSECDRLDNLGFRLVRTLTN